MGDTLEPHHTGFEDRLERLTVGHTLNSHLTGLRHVEVVDK